MKKSRASKPPEDFEIALSQAGLTIDELRANFRRDMSTARLVQKEVTSKIEVSQDQMRAYYKQPSRRVPARPEERKLREVIVLEASGLPDAELKKMAGKLQQELAAPGAKAGDIVGRYQDQGYSSGPDRPRLAEERRARKIAVGSRLRPRGRPLRGADQGPRRLPPGFPRRETRRRPAGLSPTCENQIQGRERQKRFGKEYRAYLAQLEKGSYIQENPPAEAVGYRSLFQSGAEEDELRLFRAPLAEPPAGRRHQARRDGSRQEGRAKASRPARRRWWSCRPPA